jgi:PadR family transcriptional regulator PadR
VCSQPSLSLSAVSAGSTRTGGLPLANLSRQRKLYLCRVRWVTPPSRFSAQTLSVLAALCDQPSQWQHGYALAKQTGLKSGTLYPILIRLADRGLVEACWQDEPEPGRPRRHLYRLTAAGLASATEALTSATEALASAVRPAAAKAPRTPARGAVLRVVP